MTTEWPSWPNRMA